MHFPAALRHAHRRALFSVQARERKGERSAEAETQKPTTLCLCPQERSLATDLDFLLLGVRTPLLAIAIPERPPSARSLLCSQLQQKHP